MIKITTQTEDKLLAIKQFDLTYKRFKYFFIFSLLVSVLIVAVILPLATSRIYYFIGALAYLGLMLSFSRQMRNVIQSARSIAGQNKHLAAALRKSEQGYRELFASFDEDIFFVDVAEEGVFTVASINPAAERTFGLTDAQARGKSKYELFPADLAARLVAYDRACVKSGKPLHYEELLEHSSGNRYFSVTLTPMRNVSGAIYRIAAIARDITARKLADESLRESEEKLRALYELSPVGIVLTDMNGRCLEFNEAFRAICGYPADELKTLSYWTLTPQEYENREAEKLESLSRTGRYGPYEKEYLQKDGRRIPIQLNGVLIAGKDGQDYIWSIVEDITERRRMEDAIAVREQEFRTLIEHSPDTISRYNRDCRRIYANPSFGAMVEGGVDALLGRSPLEYSGWSNSALYVTKINEVFAMGKDAEFELEYGDEVCCHVRLVAERDASGAVVTVLAVGRDMTRINAFHRKIHQMAFYDPLTSLPNRVLFNDRLRQMLTDASRHDQQAGVMLIDLDRFKAVNDALGHPAGDELLREAAARFTYCVRGYDTVARLGGDEFAILLPEIRAGDDLGRVASKILESFNEPFLLEGREVFISCSIGIALYPADGSDADELVKLADSAMYFAKRSGRNNFRFYSKDLTDSANERLTLEGDLRRGFKRDELELYYQPKVRLMDGALVGSEALLRWNHPQRGMVPPDKFISIAEDSGLIVEIGEWVLRCACRVACDWNSPGNPLHKVAINLSARQFQVNDLVKTVSLVLEETGCASAWIELEITESLLLDGDGEVLEMLDAFRAMGITIAIDDFGTGYSSLSYLARFPIDTLKIDRSFISRMTESGHHAELVKAFISIAKGLGQQAVAEGVETAEQAALLQSYGCQLAQGYFYGKPMPRNIFEDFAAVAEIG